MIYGPLFFLPFPFLHSALYYAEGKGEKEWGIVKNKVHSSSSVISRGYNIFHGCILVPSLREKLQFFRVEKKVGSRFMEL